MDIDSLKHQLKRLILEELDLQGRTEADIVDDAPLFGEGLGLDSLDALQLAMAVEERFGVEIPEDESAREIFASLSALAAHVSAVTSGAALTSGGSGASVKSSS